MIKNFFRLNPKICHPILKIRFLSLTDSSQNDTPLQSDDIVDQFSTKYNIKENLPNIKTVIPIFKERLDCTYEDALQIYDQHEKNITLLTLSELSKQLESFLALGVKKTIMLKYPEILVMNPNEVKEKLEIINKLPQGENGDNYNDYFPLLKLNYNDLEKVLKKLTKEQMHVPKGSRIHYLSHKLKVDPYVVSAVFVNYLFMFSIHLPLLYKNTDILVDFKLPAENVLRDPWVFLYSPRQTRERLIKAREVREDKLMPWMIHCPPKILEHSLKLTIDTRNILKSSNSEDQLSYLSKRLGFERAQMDHYIARFPAARKVRITKVKKILDFLLDEANFTPQQIASVPRILTFGLTQIKKRHEELSSLGYKINSLIMFCLTRKKYAALIDRIKKRRYR
uniref:CSON013656 protein n=1 Tax=Culicoides sonorensis TaxID=179676 RepID=A0A336LM22_CULSO